MNWCEGEDHHGKNKYLHKRTPSLPYIYLHFRCHQSFEWQLSFYLDTSLCGDVCGISLHFLHNLCNMLSTILNASTLSLSFKTPAPIIWNLHHWSPFTSKVKEALWNFCLFVFSTSAQCKDCINLSDALNTQKRSHTFIMKRWAF